MHFIEETGFTFEAAQIEPKFPCSFEFLLNVQALCWHATSTGKPYYGAVEFSWKGAPIMVWYCRTGDTIHLRSVG